MEPSEFVVRYGTWAALLRDCAGQLAMQGLLLRTDTAMDQFSRVRVRLMAPDGAAFALAGEVVQHIPGQGLAVRFTNEAVPELQRLLGACEARAADGEARDDDPVVETAGGDREQDDDVAGDNLPKQLEQMSVAQKRQAALHGRKSMRTLLIRDRNKTIHPFVIKNPAITLDEIAQIAKMPGVNPDVLRAIAKNPDWIRSTTVCRNLVRNPKTPLREAVALVGKLPVAEVRHLAKTSNVRTAIQQAARKKILT